MTHPRSNPRRRPPRAPRPSAPYHPSADPWAVQRALIAEHQMHAAAARQQARYDVEAAGVAEYHDAEAERLEAELDAAGRGRKKRKNPIPPRDEAFLLDPFEFVAGTVLEDYCPEEDAGFFHVTMRGKKVFDEGRLRSRKDVGVVGLGGGLNDPGKHVSVVINFDRALWLYNAIKGLSEAANNGTAVDVLRLVLDWTGFPGSEWSYSLDTEDEGPLEDLGQMAVEIGLDPPSDLAELTSRAGWDDLISAQGEQINEEHRTPRQRYKLAQFIEDRLESTFYFPEDWNDGTCVPLVGFTAEASDFVRSVDPEDVTIVQVALRGTTEPRPPLVFVHADKRADVLAATFEEVSRECELRLPPDHIQIVAIGCENGGRISVPPRDEERENPGDWVTIEDAAFDTHHDAHADEVDDWVTIEECACHSCAPARMNPPKRKATGAYADLDSIIPVIAEALAKHGLTMDGFEGGVEGVKFTRGGKSRAGACSYSPSLRKCKIMFNGLAWPAFTEEQRLNTVLHEAAHAIEFLTTGRSGHGPRWQSIARSIGCTGDRCMSVEASQAMVDAYAEAKGLPKRKVITPESAREASVDFAVGDYVSFDHKRERWMGKIVSKGPMHATVMIQSPRQGITGKIPYPSLQKEAPPRHAEKVAGVDKPAPGESLSAWQARTGRGARANPLPRSGEELSWTLGPSGLQERDVEDTYITIRRRKATAANEALKDLGFIDEDFFESRGSFLFIEEMAVSSKDRRQGIGRKLVEEALRGAKSPVWVIAAPLGSSEHPEGFYKRLGFEPVLQNRHSQTLMVRR